MRQGPNANFANRNKFANAFAQLLSSEVENSNDFKRLILDEDDD